MSAFEDMNGQLSYSKLYIFFAWLSVECLPFSDSSYHRHGDQSLHKTAFAFRETSTGNLRQGFYLHLNINGSLEFGVDRTREVVPEFACVV